MAVTLMIMKMNSYGNAKTKRKKAIHDNFDDKQKEHLKIGAAKEKKQSVITSMLMQMNR